MGRLMVIVCLVVLAHLILMTSEVGAEDHHTGLHEMRGHVVDQTLFTSPMDATPCFTTQLWVEPSRFTPSTQLQATSLTIHFQDSLPLHRSWIVTPSRPPDVIRALLQVYRI